MFGSPSKRVLTDLRLFVMCHPSKSPFQSNLWTRIHLDIKPQKKLRNLLKKKISLLTINPVLVEDDLTADLEEEEITTELRPLNLKRKDKLNKKELNSSEEEDEEAEEEEDAISTLMSQINLSLTELLRPKMNREAIIMKLAKKTNNNPLSEDVEEVSEEVIVEVSEEVEDVVAREEVAEHISKTNLKMMPHQLLRLLKIQTNRNNKKVVVGAERTPSPDFYLSSKSTLL